MNHPALLVLLTVAGFYVVKLWRDDLRAFQAGKSRAGALPGATPAPFRASALGAFGALLLVAAETAGEGYLGLTGEQSRLTWLAALYSVCAAPIVEELIFRGWIVVTNRGKAALWGSALAASAGFALLHPFLWQWDAAGFRLTLTTKGAFSTGFAFAASLWFYAIRFYRGNPHHSLLPCFVAHASKNGAVIVVKAASGFMGGLW